MPERADQQGEDYSSLEDAKPSGATDKLPEAARMVVKELKAWEANLAAFKEILNICLCPSPLYPNMGMH